MEKIIKNREVRIMISFSTVQYKYIMTNKKIFVFDKKDFFI